MIPASSRWFTASSIAPSAGHPLLPHRGFTQLATLGLLDTSPLGQACRKVVRFQKESDCVGNAQRIQWSLQAELIAQNLLHRPQAMTRLPWSKLQQWMFGSCNRRVEMARKVPRLVELNERHGPLMLVLHGALPAGDGAQIYPNHHALVLLATWRNGGRQFGLLIDGNDQQRNASIAAIKAWQIAHDDARPLDELSPQDLQRISEDTRQQADTAQEPILDTFQFAYRLVDLGAMLERAQTHYQAALQRAQDVLLEPVEPYPNSVAYDPECLLRTPLLSADLLDSLNAAIEQDASLVEPEC